MAEKRIVSINLGNFGSTGTIIRGISDAAKTDVFETFFCYPDCIRNVNLKKNDYIIGKEFFQRINQKLSYYTGLDGYFAFFSTMQLLKYLKVIKPDCIHLHNIHNNYINIPLFFRFIKKNNIKIIWTLHDCWAFTGHCPHFVSIDCDKWKQGCHLCPRYRDYPHMAVDSSRLMWKKKKKWFSGINSMAIVTPSEWLAGLVKDSFLKSYPVYVINNGIDLTEFTPRSGLFRQKQNLIGKKVLLGVAFDWSPKKGLDEFLRLANDLSDDYRIVLVGVENDIGEKNDRIITVKRTSNMRELSEIYSMADLFVNPTYEDSFPTVNIEALACGTPVITYDTGGAKEMLSESCGMWIATGDYEQLKEGIKTMLDKNISSETCIRQASLFDKKDKFEEYISLYCKLQ